jgi:hypothetical protein
MARGLGSREMEAPLHMRSEKHFAQPARLYIS